MTTAVHTRERTAWPQPAAADLRTVGQGLTVPLVTGGVRHYANLDHSASAPCLVAVKEAVDALLPWYSSVHRGAGFPSRVATAAYEGARDAVLDLVGAPAGDTVVFTRHITEAINVLANALPEDAGVAGEHHADLLPWLRGRATVLPVPASPDEAVGLLDDALVAARGEVGLVAVTGASNVTGEIWPYAEIAEIAHRHGARLLLDAAQLAPHRPIDMAAAGVDYLALSGHKLYAPFGAGVLVGRPDWLADREPLLAGGGAVRYVTVDSVLWAEPPDRHKAGSPNVVGAVALGVGAGRCRRWGWRQWRRSTSSSVTRRSGWPRSRGPAAADVGTGRSRSACSRSRSRGCRTHGGRGAQRGVRHRGAARVLLRPPAGRTPARRRCSDPRAHPVGDERAK